MNNLLIVLTGKTASGKDTVMAKLLSKYPNLNKVTTTTSRKPRPGEKDGVDYFFISEDDFKRKIEKGGFIEYVQYGGNFYGTEKSEISNNLANNLIWRIDPSRAGQIREFIKDSFEPNLANDLLQRLIVIYLTVDDQTIMKRLTGRKFSIGEIQKRMQDDFLFWQRYKGGYDYVIENIQGKLDETIDQVSRIIEAHHTP